MPYITRVTNWFNDRGSLIQVSAAMLDDQTWDVLSHATERVGPFDDVELCTAAALRAARNLAAGQYTGQESLFD